MYYRRWTRMHLYPAIKYFTKYGLLDQKYQKLMPLHNMENPKPDHFNRRRLSKAELREKDLDTKLIEKLFLKYPDLKYEPISHQKYPGKKLNTFSYAFSFIREQKKLIEEGYTVDKAFQLVEQKYQKDMQRKLDQTLLSRGLAVGNRARSFLNIYQQQVQYESRLKVLRTQRELQKYEQKLNKLKLRVQEDQEDSDTKLMENYERMFQKIVKDQAEAGYEEGKKSMQSRNDMIQGVEKGFKNIFQQFYKRAAYRDRLEGLTDEEIINSVHSTPNKIKRQNKLLIEFLTKKGSITIDHIGQVRVSQNENPKLREFLLTNPEVKIALLTEKLNYEKPSYIRRPNKRSLMQRRKTLLQTRPDKLTKEEKDLINYNKKLNLEMVSQNDVPNKREAYKIFESSEQRLLRLQLKYLDMVCQKEMEELENKKKENDQQAAKKHKKRYQEAQYTLGETIQKFRRIKYRLENKFRQNTADEFLFKEHVQLNDEMQTQDADYEDLLLYLRKRVQQRRLTSIRQANDNKMHSYLQKEGVPEYPESQGEIKGNIE